MQKEVYPVSESLQHYLRLYGRDIQLPITYKELFHYQYTNALKDEKGKHTHWERAVYQKDLLATLQQKLIVVYTLLKKENAIVTKNLQLQSIDFCEFANSMPFRINILHTNNNTTGCFYIKDADASRIYGLELEQLLSTNNINFLYHQNTLVEEHIEGTPGDIFLSSVDHLTNTEKKLLATEFVRFNERCFTRLLGDMRSYNFVVVKNENNHQHPFHLKSIDFDQQCYEGKLNLYLPQFYKENYGYVQMTMQLLKDDTIEQIRTIEKQQMAKAVIQHRRQLTALLQAMMKEEISENYKVVSLRKELNAYFNTRHFTKCKTMGAIVKQQLRQLLHPYLVAANTGVQPLTQ